jgi:catechol 2,3-dioxygenase-like lactoylglutathione lyase family enzyme
MLTLEHVGIVVRDLGAAVAFFLDLGFEEVGQFDITGDWVDRLFGFNDMTINGMILAAPDGGGRLELSTFVEPAMIDVPANLPPVATGFRHISCRVSDIDGILERVQTNGYSIVGEIVDYEDTYRMACVRGPEGLLIEISQAL